MESPSVHGEEDVKFGVPIKSVPFMKLKSIINNGLALTRWN